MCAIIWNGIHSPGMCHPRKFVISKQGDLVIIFAMILTQEEVEHIADMARLLLSDEEKARYREQLSAILDYAKRLQEADTSQIPPTSTVLAQRATLRPDEPAPGLSIDEVLRNAPLAEQNQFRVPPVME
jgi:aspartyl-tRNA(Asn)/glutamyl-tRNA(Gln) amidotransferase subunit C